MTEKLKIEGSNEKLNSIEDKIDNQNSIKKTDAALRNGEENISIQNNAEVNADINDDPLYKIYGYPKSLYTIAPENANEFTYSKKSHLEFFKRYLYDINTFGRRSNLKYFNITEYQNLLVYSFIKKNLPKRSKILQIGNENTFFFDEVVKNYEFWRIENVNDLTIDTSLESDINIPARNCATDSEENLSYSYFDFIFSISAFEQLKANEDAFKNILYNLTRLTREGGYALHCFYYIFVGNELWANYFLFFLFNNTLTINKRLNRFFNNDMILNDPDAFSTFEKLSSVQSSKYGKKRLEDLVKIFSLNIFLRKIVPPLLENSPTKSRTYLEKTPVYVFHHLIKCGGTSVTLVLPKWFNIEYDRVELSDNVNDYLKYKLNVDRLLSDNCIVSHFQNEGIFLHQRYPEILEQKNKFRIFTFIRDPLQFRISLYYYNKKKAELQNYALGDVMLNNPNFIARMFPCDESNYIEVLDRYFFIGIVEKMQESFDKLADLTNKKRIILPVVNVSQKDSQIDGLTPEFIRKFKDANKLDYLIYEYCLEKFSNM